MVKTFSNRNSPPTIHVTTIVYTGEPARFTSSYIYTSLRSTTHRDRVLRYNKFLSLKHFQGK